MQRNSLKHIVWVLVVAVLVIDLVAINVICYRMVVGGVPGSGVAGSLPAEPAGPAPYEHVASQDGLPFSWPPPEWQRRCEAFVPGRPDLTGPLTDVQISGRTEHVARYFESAGVDRDRVKDMQFAYTTTCTLVSFKLSPSDVARFLEGKAVLDDPADLVLGGLYASGRIVTEGPGPGDMSTYNFDALREYPFVRLDWWPVDTGTVRTMRVYEAQTTWDFNEMHAGASYFILLEDSGRGYLIGG